MSNEEAVTLVALAQDGDGDAMDELMRSYEGLVQFTGRSYFIQGGDRHDVLQEARIGLFKAIRDYKIAKLTNFTSFVSLCVHRQLVTALKTATRQKHHSLNKAISLDATLYADADRTLLDIVAARPEQGTNAELAALVREAISDGARLSDLEASVMLEYMKGSTYQQTARNLGMSVKCVDNAMQRIKRKVELRISTALFEYRAAKCAA